MKLTDYESGVVFNIDIDIIGGVFGRGSHTDVLTFPDENGPVFKVRERVMDIVNTIIFEKEIERNGYKTNSAV